MTSQLKGIKASSQAELKLKTRNLTVACAPGDPSPCPDTHRRLAANSHCIKA